MKNNFKNNKASDGWELISTTPEPKKISIKDFELLEFLKDGEKSIQGKELIKRADNSLNQYHAEYFLEHQDEIPKEWRNYYLLFPRTVWQNRYGNRRVPYLYWSGERWYLRFDWLGSDFSSSRRLLRSRKSLENLGDLETRILALETKLKKIKELL